MKTLHLFFLLFCLILTAQNKKIKSEIHTDVSSQGIPGHYYKIEYDPTGFMKRWTEYNSEDSIQSVRVYTKAKNGKVQADTLYSNTREVLDYWEYQYDASGELIKQKRTYPQEKNQYVEGYKFELDSAGNKIVERQYDKDNKLEWEYFYKYDVQKRLVHSLSKSQGENREEYDYVFHDSLLTKKVLYSYDDETKRREIFCIWHYTYDLTGRKLKEEAHSVGSYLKKKIVDTTEYEYNEFGHVIKETRKKDGVFKSMVKVKYEYY